MTVRSEYKAVGLSHITEAELDGDCRKLSSPQRVAGNIPDYEVEGWKFSCMIDEITGLFRRDVPHRD